MKKLLNLSIATNDGNRAINCDLEYCDKGLYLGVVNLSPSTRGICSSVNFHVEAIEVKVVARVVTAVNALYDNRIDRYTEANDGEYPQTVSIGKKKYYVSITPFAH